MWRPSGQHKWTSNCSNCSFCTGVGWNHHQIITLLWVNLTILLKKIITIVVVETLVTIFKSSPTLMFTVVILFHIIHWWNHQILKGCLFFLIVKKYFQNKNRLLSPFFTSIYNKHQMYPPQCTLLCCCQSI